MLEAKHVAEAALHYAKITGATNEAHADCLRIITRAEIRMANELDAARARGEIASRGADGTAIRDQVHDQRGGLRTLSDLGITSQQSHHWHRMAEAGEEAVDDVIAEAAEEAERADRKVTKTAVHRKLHAKRKRSDPTPVVPPRPEQLVSLSLWLRRGGEIIPQFTDDEEAIALAAQHRVIFDADKVHEVAKFLTSLDARIQKHFARHAGAELGREATGE